PIPARTPRNQLPIASSAATDDHHSFPTRRSSDLRPARAPPPGAPCTRDRPGAARSPRAAGSARRSRRSHVEASASPRARATRTRSEEHTSELQSLAYLVCRLLLEKKKNSCKLPVF